MTPEQFCYWLQGALELGTADTLDAGQVDMIREHLALVFTKVTRVLDPGNEFPKMQRETLDAQKAVDDLRAKRAEEAAERMRQVIDEVLARPVEPRIVPRWPDETKHDPLSVPPIGGRVMGLYDPSSAPICSTGDGGSVGQVIDLKGVSFC